MEESVENNDVRHEREDREPVVSGRHFTNLSNTASLVLIILIVSAVMLPMAFTGIPDSYDLMHHMRFAGAYHESLLTGELIPKWAASDNFGFGSIGVRYYPPLAYYALALTKIVTGSWYHSFWLTSFGWALLGSLGVFLWVRQWASNLAATLAAVLYILVPYHTFQIYQIVIYAEFVAAGVLPFCFLFLTRLCQRRRWIDSVLFAASYSLLVLTHIPSAIITTICIAIYGLLVVDWRYIGDTALKGGAAVAASGLAVSFHLVKAVTELGWVQHNSPEYFSDGSYDYRSYFFPMYFSAPWHRYVQKMLWNFDAIIVLTIGVFLLALIAYLVLRGADQHGGHGTSESRAVAVTGVFSLFMLSIGSSFIWSIVPVLAKIQFPWRWLTAASMFGAVSLGTVLAALFATRKKLSRLVAYPVFLFIAGVLVYDISLNILPSNPLSKTQFEEKVDNMANEEGCPCWWPIWARAAAFNRPERAAAEGRVANVVHWGRESRTFEIGPGESTALRVATFYHPYWFANVNGESVSVGRDENGVVVFPVPAQQANVHLFFKEPAYLRIFAILSSLMWAAFAVLVAGYLIQRRRPVV